MISGRTAFVTGLNPRFWRGFFYVKKAVIVTKFTLKRR